MKKILVITNLFPNRKEPNRSTFNRQQLTALAKECEVHIIAPVPFFKYSKADVPATDTFETIPVYHPRYLVIPKILRSLYGIFYFCGVIGTTVRIKKEFDFECILATWAYPDAYAAALISQVVKKPFFVKVHGTDINVLTRYRLRRWMITYALKKAQAVVAVSSALKKRIVALGIDEKKVRVIPNSINNALFSPRDKQQCRQLLALGSERKIVVYIGNLEHIKGVDVLIEAFALLPETIDLVVVGAGTLKTALEKRVQEIGSERAVHFVGAQPHHKIPEYINAADVFCLPSRNEGCPNVVLEALACGVPVVGTMVGGTPDFVRDRVNGILVEPENPQLLADGILQVIGTRYDRQRICQSVQIFTWENNAKDVFELLSSDIN